MKRLSIQTFIFSIIVLISSGMNIALAAISVTPKFLFLDPTKRSVAINVTNNGNEDDELWVEAKFGYVVSDDTGGIHVIYDSSDAVQNSAASWIRAYPQRFILGPDETQIVRLVVSPPAGIAHGEYWARINISSKPRKPAISVRGAKFGSGIILVSQVGVAFHYRYGDLTTAIQLSDIKSTNTDSTVDVKMTLTKTGTASFWGVRVVRLVNESGKVVYTSTKELVVYKNLTLRERISKRNVPPGNYKLETDFLTGNRKDIQSNNLIQAPPLRISNPLIVQ